MHHHCLCSLSLSGIEFQFLMKGFVFLHKVTSLLANFLGGLALGTGENIFSQETEICGTLSLHLWDDGCASRESGGLQKTPRIV